MEKKKKGSSKGSFGVIKDKIDNFKFYFEGCGEENERCV